MRARFVLWFALGMGAASWGGCAVEDAVTEDAVEGTSEALAGVSRCGAWMDDGELPLPPEDFEDCLVVGSNAASACCDSEGFECGEAVWDYYVDDWGYCSGVWSATISCKGEEVDCNGVGVLPIFFDGIF